MLDTQRARTFFSPIQKIPVTLVVGSCMTRVWYDDSLLLQVRTCIVIEKKSKELLSFGDQAWSFFEHENQHTQVVFPVRHGEVAHTLFFQLFLTQLFQHILSHLDREKLFLRWDVRLLITNDLSPAKQKITRRSLDSIGVSQVELISELAHDFRQIEKKVRTRNALIINIGCQQTQMGVFSGAACVHFKKIPWGGIYFTQHIMQQIRQEYDCEVGFKTAEAVKIAIGSVQKKKKKKHVVVGKDLQSHLAASRTVDAALFVDGFLLYVQELVTACKDFFADAHSEVLTAALKNTIFLTGGGSRLDALEKVLQKQLGVEVVRFDP